MHIIINMVSNYKSKINSSTGNGQFLISGLFLIHIFNFDLFPIPV